MKIEGLPEGTTHVFIGKAINTSGSCFTVYVHSFKYVNEVLKVFTTDSDGEYPQWKDACRVFSRIPGNIQPL